MYDPPTTWPLSLTAEAPLSFKLTLLLFSVPRSVSVYDCATERGATSRTVHADKTNLFIMLTLSRNR
jgi:hypothetical protein